MAVKYEKQTPKPKAAAKPAPLETVAVATEVVDEFLTLHKEIEAAQAKFNEKWKGKLKQRTDLQKTILHDATQGLDDEASVELVGSGNLGIIEIAAKTNQTSITDMVKVRELLGDDLFFALAKVNLGDLDDYMTKPQLMLVTKTERTGSRRFKVK